MNVKDTDLDKYNQKYYQIITLWAVLEGFLGGLIHGLHIPISGLLVGSGAIFCITLLGIHFPEKGAILKAFVIVAACKFLLSPQSPPTAYLALAFQSILGQILFSTPWSLRVKCFLLSIISLVESGIQRLLVVYFIFGMGFMDAFDDWMNKVMNSFHISSYSLLFMILYLLLHLVVGIWLGNTLSRLLKIKRDSYDKNIEMLSTTGDLINNKKSSSWFWSGVLLGLLCFIYFDILNQKDWIYLVFRTSIFIIGWFFVIIPLFHKLMSIWIKNSHDNRYNEVQAVMHSVPNMLTLVKFFWQKNSNLAWWKRIKLFYYDLGGYFISEKS